jgi:hypothetical protein
MKSVTIPIENLLILEIGIFLGGVISGFSGFAFSAVAGVFLLTIYPPRFAVPLMVFCGLLTQLYSVYRIRTHIRWKDSAPYIAGGAPIGIYALYVVQPSAFNIGFGLFVAAYAAWILGSQRAGFVKPRTMANAVVGAAAGVVGGLTAMPGALPIM